MSTIELRTETDLQTSPVGTFVRGLDGFLHIKVSPNRLGWVLITNDNRADPADYTTIELPATLLYNPRIHGERPKFQTQEPKDIFSQARELINGDRQQDYGDKQTNFQRIADLWTAYSDSPFGPKDVAVMMILVKIARIANTETHKDSWLDIIGYAGIGEDLE